MTLGALVRRGPVLGGALAPAHGPALGRSVTAAPGPILRRPATPMGEASSCTAYARRHRSGTWRSSKCPIPATLGPAPGRRSGHCQHRGSSEVPKTTGNPVRMGFDEYAGVRRLRPGIAVIPVTQRKSHSLKITLPLKMLKTERTCPFGLILAKVARRRHLP